MTYGIKATKRLEGREKGHQERCICNKLLCIIRGDTIEIKCNKCKRFTRIKTKGIVEIERS